MISYKLCNGSYRSEGRKYDRKTEKSARILFLVLCLGSISVVTASAAEIADSDLETDEDFSEDTTYSMLRGNNLNFGTTAINKLASNKVAISGITQCHHVCGTVYLTLKLERKVKGVYSVYKTWEFTASNATNLAKNITVIVPSGYYYRVRGYHAAKDGSKESVSTLTKGVLVK